MIGEMMKAAVTSYSTLLAPDMVEAILMDNESSGLSLTKLTKVKSAFWTEQRKELGFVP